MSVKRLKFNYVDVYLMENVDYTEYDKMLDKYSNIVDVSNPLDLEILDLIISRGANINYTTELNENVLFRVVKNIEAFMYFFDKGADISRRNSKEETVLEVALVDGCNDVVNFCADRLSKIKLTGNELLNITNLVYFDKSCVEVGDRRVLFYRILDSVSDDCLESFVNNANEKMLSHIAIKLLSRWDNVDRLKDLNMPSIGHFYDCVSVNSIEDFKDNSIFLKFEDDNFNTFKRVLKHFAKPREFFWYIENNGEVIKDKKIRFNFKNKSVSPVVYIFKSLKNYVNTNDEHFLINAMKKVDFILKNKICREVTKENIFNSFFEYTDKVFNEMRYINITANNGGIGKEMLNALDLLSSMPNEVTNWGKVNGQNFINNIALCKNGDAEFIALRDKVLLNFGLLKNNSKVLNDRKKVKI